MAFSSVVSLTMASLKFPIQFLSLTHIGLLPALEVALLQIEEHFGEQGLSVVGYYHANERYDDLELGNAAKKISDHICRYFPQAAILLLDNKKLETVPRGEIGILLCKLVLFIYFFSFFSHFWCPCFLANI
ncbi:PREDICTED: ER membrane protein complex subunit 8/9 homolog [Nelumbo nucifera]|uniref:ER membrane protein complex subunit 8/9 homolog n=1 Tax=Nelumbo nucifera TaxID=4432 RepID=A0A1U7ZD14_NELNU|nr:PREDICTED: ER membrane protein complex subunit 8/9 homolog [Nelumbo nucifera]